MKTENWFQIIIALFLCGLGMGLCIGILCSDYDFRREAVRTGNAHYKSDKYGDSVFEWNNNNNNN